MSLLYRFKPQKDAYLRSIATRLGSAGITANEVTALGLCLALGSGLLAYRGYLYLAIVCFASSAVLGANVPPSAFVVVGGAFTLLFARAYGHGHKWGATPTTFGRPERLALLVVGIFCSTPINTLLFVAAGLCCVFSSAQILAPGNSVQGEQYVGGV